MIDKSMNPAPQGLEQVSQDQEPLEIEIEDPESVTIRHGDEELIIKPDEGEDDSFNDNLAEELTDSVLQSLASDLLADFDSDISARHDWVTTYVDGIELLGLNLEERSEPWEGGKSVV